jgi:hypothetical protein
MNMLKTGARSFILFIIFFLLYTCIDPYTPKLRGYESLLVVDGLITDENRSYTVVLSRTISEQHAIPEMVSDAKIFITDDGTKRVDLESKGKGIYKTDSAIFRGVVGKNYILHIITREGDEFESEPCLMETVPDIDSIYFAKDFELVNNDSETNEGIRIYLDSKEGDSSKCYRWDFEETWKFKIPLPTKAKYMNEYLVLPVTNYNEYCWKSRRSDDILIHQVYAGQSNRIEKIPVTFIATDKSDRLLLQYSILIKQYSISKKEYEFWNNLSKVNENGGDIFAAIPYPVVGNIHSISNPEEKVLGYFRVSAIKQRRKEIPFSEIVPLDLPFYHYPCNRIEDSPFILPWAKFTPPLTWDDIYQMYTTSGYAFVEPKYIHGTSVLDRLVFTSPECADCELTGTLKKPDFWIELN